MKIRTTIFGVYVAASALGLVVLMGLLLHEVRQRQIDAARRALGDTAAMVAPLLGTDETAASGELGAVARRNLTTLVQAAGPGRIYVTDPRGIVVFDGREGRDVGRDYTLRPETAAHFARGGDGRGDAGVVAGELRATAPVRRGERTVGFVGVARPFDGVTSAVLRTWERLVVIALVMAGVMTSAGWWIASKLTHSLERLTHYAEDVRDGRRASPPSSRALEIAALGRAFEEMRVALEGKAHVERYTQALAHEFKAPLSAIRGAAELLGEEMPREERARFIRNLRSESDRMQRLVDRLLELSALEARHGRVEFTRVGLRAVVEEVCAGARTAAAPRGISVEVTGDGAAEVAGERFLLAQAVGNLVQNAVEFSPADAVVAIDLTVRDGRVTLTVTDRGPGVPGFALERVFDRFYSLPRPESGRKSSGLGLSIVREIARLHRGEIALENRDEGGARATLTLPLA